MKLFEISMKFLRSPNMFPRDSQEATEEGQEAPRAKRAQGEDGQDVAENSPWAFQKVKKKREDLARVREE